MRRWIVVAAIALTMATETRAYWFSQCSDPSVAAISGAARSVTTFDFNDLGVAFMAARHNSIHCRIDAGRILYSKLQEVPPAFWKSFLAGAPVALYLATALELGGHGNLPLYVEEAARDIALAYEANYEPSDPCGFEGDLWARANTCMDDHAVAASGYAWVTAYLRLTGREWLPSRARTIESIRRSFRTPDSICIHDPSRYKAGTNPCNATVAELGVGETRIISLNHGNQTPAYGVGLLPSIAAAFVGLEVAGAPVDPYTELTADERKIIEYLWIEGQEHTDAFGTFNPSSCFNMNAATRTLEKPWGCFDQQFVSGDPTDGSAPAWPMDGQGITGYQARWYYLRPFFEKYGFGRGYSYRFQFDRPVDTFDTGVTNFFGPGRRETFLTLGGSWVEGIARPPMSGNGTYLVALKTDAGRYVGLTPRTFGLMAERLEIGATEVFTILDLGQRSLASGDQISVRVSGGDHVRIAPHGTIGFGRLIGPTPPDMILTIEKLGGDVRFIADGDPIALRARTGRYLTLAGDGSISATAETAGPRETFRFMRVEPARP